jgi:hypothetical protein
MSLSPVSVAVDLDNEVAVALKKQCHTDDPRDAIST